MFRSYFNRSVRQERCLVRGWLAVSAIPELLIRSYSSGQYGRSGAWSGAGWRCRLTGTLDQELFIRSVRQGRCLVRGWLAGSAALGS
jgi:hypothetical protein